MELHLHPDNVVIIRDGNEVLYMDTPENFALDYGEALEVNEGWNERLYIPGVIDRHANGFTESTTTNPWTQGDDILASKDDIIAAKESRLEE